MSAPDDNPDRVLWGAKAIGREANVIDADGNVNERRAYYLLEAGLLPASKTGRSWTSTPRRIRRHFSGENA